MVMKFNAGSIFPLWFFMVGFLLLSWFAAAADACGQDLEPRAYSPSPVGTWFAGVGWSRSSGDIAFDPSIPITDAHATLNAPALGIGNTFGVFGRQALLTAGLPYARGTVYGEVGNDEQSVYRSGLADVKVRFSVNLRGSPALSAKEFAKRTHRNFIIGTSVFITAPSGQYGNTKLINIGTNRWSFKPEVGVSYPVKKLDLDLYAGVTFFTENGAFYTGQSIRTQEPLTALQAHVSYTIRRGLWAAIDSTWYGGGSTVVNGGAPSERQGNSRLGATISLPIKTQQSVKVTYSSGVSGNIGQKFNTVGVGWQYVWFGRRW
jgi:Putative MetA-pathway of phenol degradation